MFATLFLGAVLAVFLTLNVVRGDAESGLLQPLVVRPVGRAQLLLARFIGAAGRRRRVCARRLRRDGRDHSLAGGWTARPARRHRGSSWRPRWSSSSALALAGSVFFAPIANGIGTLHGLRRRPDRRPPRRDRACDPLAELEHIARIAWWVLPFDALYEDALHRLTVDTTGFAQFVLTLGPFGGSHHAGTPMLAWAAAYLGLVGAAALAAFSIRDL